MGRTFAISVSLLLLLSLNLEAAIRRRASRGGLRRKVHVADIITTPGTIEAEWYHDYSSNGGYTMPSLLKMSPLSNTEFSVAFDPVVEDGATVTAFTVLTSGQKFSLAAGPQIHLGSKTQAGGVGLARWDLGAHNIGFTASYVGTLDLGAGYGVQIGKWTPHFNFLWERGGYRAVTEGIAYQMSKKLTLDLAGQHDGANQLQFGLIYNFGKFRR